MKRTQRILCDLCMTSLLFLMALIEQNENATPAEALFLMIRGLAIAFVRVITQPVVVVLCMVLYMLERAYAYIRYRSLLSIRYQ